MKKLLCILLAGLTPYTVGGADLELSADVDTLLGSANFAAFRSSLSVPSTATTITIAGTANEITSSAGAQSLAGNRTWTLSLPSALTFTGKTITEGTFNSPAISSATIDGATFGDSLLLFGDADPSTPSTGMLAFDSNAWAASRGAVQVHDGTANTWVIAALASDTPTNGQVPTWNTGGTITWESPGAASVDEGGDYTWTGTHDFTGATLSFDTFSVTTLNATTITGAGGGLTLNAAGFNGNLATTDNTLQEVAQKLDDLTAAFDATGIDAVTWSDGANASNIWTFNVSGTDHTMTAGNGVMTYSHGLTVLGTTTVGTVAGAIDAGGATSLEVPNGNDPDVDAEGEISWDANGDTLRVYDGAIQVAVGRKIETIQCTVITPNDLADAQRDAFLVWSNESGMSFVVTGWKVWSGTDDTTLNIEEVDADGVSSNATVDAVEAATGSGPFTGSDTTITGATIENGHLLVLDFDDTDTPTYVKITITGYYAADVN